ncbi:hypothetical protein EC968_006319 [Mortierella alpina]|nr:hypothetical protein EC968_006319 [Mortierella alpina]
MRATLLCTLFFATFAMGVQAQASGPMRTVNPDFTFIADQMMFVGDGWLPTSDIFESRSRVDQFYALDLTVPWTSDAPAWTRLARRANVFTSVSTAGTMAPTKDGTTVLFFDALGVYRYNIKTNDWDTNQKATLIRGFHAGATTDTDTGLVYGVSEAMLNPFGPGRPTRVTEFNPATNNFTVHEHDGLPLMSGGGSTIYSSAAKSLYLYEWGNINALFKYDIVSKAWSSVNATGDIPSSRHNPCFAPAYGGKKLILAGGASLRGADEVHIFDVATSVWTKTSSKPTGYFTAACAVAGDSLILWGGGHGAPGNDGGPIVLDIPSGKWGTKYTPGPASVNPVTSEQSATDRGARALPMALSAVVAVATILCIL